MTTHQTRELHAGVMSGLGVPAAAVAEAGSSDPTAAAFGLLNNLDVRAACV